MKKLFSLNLLIALAVVFASCGTNNNVVNNRLISKRKYNKGFHINRKGNMKSSKVEEEESIAFEDVKSQNKKEEKSSNNTIRKSSDKADVLTHSNANFNIIVYEEDAPHKPILRNEQDVPADGNDGFSFEESQAIPDYDSENETSTPKQHMSKKEAKKMARSAAGGGNSDLMNILLIVLLVIVVFALISLIGGTLGWILSVIVLVLIIYFLLKLLGVI